MSSRDTPQDEQPTPIVPAQIRDVAASLPPWASPTPAPMLRAPGVVCEVVSAASRGPAVELVLDARAVATRSRLAVQVDSTSNPTLTAILVSPTTSVRGTCDPAAASVRFTIFGDTASKASLLVVSPRPVRLIIRSADGLLVVGPLELKPDHPVAAVMWGDD
jgi:hypothetical protein